MKRGNNNVFKLSGNLALGGGNEYLGAQNPRGNTYAVSNGNTIKKTSNYGQSYENKYDYDYSQKTGTSESRKYSKNQQQTASYNPGMNYRNQSTKKIQVNYQNSLNRMETTDSYNNRGTYKNPDSYKNYNTGSQKEVYNNDKYQVRNPMPRDENRKYQRPSQNQEYNKAKFKMPYQEPQQYINNRVPPKASTRQSNQVQNKNNYQQPSSNDYYENNTKNQVKQYDPSTFVMCRQGCGRKFNPDSISKHEKICKKVFQNKRPEFNVQEQRIVAKQQKKLMKQGEIIEKKIEQKKKVEQKKENMPKWKAESLGFRAILKANRRGGEMTQEQKKLVSQAQQSGMVKCKFCGRSFNEKAAERHIPFCQSQQKKNAMKKKK